MPRETKTITEKSKKAAEKKVEKHEQKTPEKGNAPLAVVRIRGIRNIEPEIGHTLNLMRLNRPNHCVIVSSDQKSTGMINIVKDYVAYGPISENTIYDLIKKRGEKGRKNISETVEDAELKEAAKQIFNGKKVSEFVDPVFRLHPPRRGLKNVKLHYPRGELGKRESMDDLIKRMM